MQGVKEAAAAMEKMILERREVPVIDRLDDKQAPGHLVWMLRRIRKPGFANGKQQRWLGFVQGVMAVTQIATVDEMADATREFFQGEW